MENFDNFNSISKVHIIGIGGVSMSALAKLFLKSGKNVSGSDNQENAYIKQLKDLRQQYIDKGFHLQRLYRRRSRMDTAGNFVSAYTQIIEPL